MTTVTSINDTIITQLESQLGQSIPLLPKSFNRVIAKIIAGVIITLYKYADWMFLQWFVSTASAQDTEILGRVINPLNEWGELVGLGPRTAATQAELLIDITVENQVGTLSSGTQLVNTDNGVTYITIGDVLLNAATVQATIRAVSDQSGNSGRGTLGNLQPADEVRFINPIDNVARIATVDSQVVTAADAETADAYRTRVLRRFQQRAQGGAYADYKQWAEAVAGIVNAYPYTGDPGQVDVYVEATVASSGSADGIPTAAQLTAVLDYINDQDVTTGKASRRNANAFVNSLPITRTGFDVEVVGITGVTDLAAVQSDITDALTEYFLDAEPFIGGLSIPPRKDRLTQTRVAALVEDIVSAANGTFTSARFFETGGIGGLVAYSLSEGEKSKLVNLSFT